MDLLKRASTKTSKLLQSTRDFVYDFVSSVKENLEPDVVEAEENEVQINEVNETVELILYKNQSSEGLLKQ
jgi:hypothetical protein